jgi:hypothetical protein
MIKGHKTGTLLDASYTASAGKLSISYRLDGEDIPVIRTYDRILDNLNDTADTLILFGDNGDDVTLSRMDDAREILHLKAGDKGEVLIELMRNMALVKDTHSAMLKLNISHAQNTTPVSNLKR